MWHVLYIESMKLEIDTYPAKIQAVDCIKKLYKEEFVVKDSITLIKGELQPFQANKKVLIDLTFFEENTEQ
jgi:hypothetical protein